MELSVHHDKIINTIEALKSHERQRSSEAGEDREEIGNLLELTGLNKNAFAFIRKVDKMEPDKREDVLRSLHPLLDMMDKRWNGQTTPDLFEEGDKKAAPADDFDKALERAAE